MAQWHDTPAASANLSGMNVSRDNRQMKYHLLTPAAETKAVRSLMSGESPIVLRLWTVEATGKIKMVPDRAP